MEFNEIMEQIVQFTKERDWDQFHNGKDLALALSIEASELNEVFLWKKPEEVNVEKIKEELADAIIAVMEPIQERYYELLKSDKLDEILDEGAKKANYVANKTLRKMEKAVGLVR